MYKLFALAFLICGIVLFMHFNDSQRQYEIKLRRIQAGEIQPETLIVVSKRASNSQNGSSIKSLQSAQGWVVFHNSRQEEVLYPAPSNRDLYKTVNPGSTATAYHFSDGYFIPQFEPDHDAGTSKWTF